MLNGNLGPLSAMIRDLWPSYLNQRASSPASHPDVWTDRVALLPAMMQSSVWISHKSWLYPIISDYNIWSNLQQIQQSL